MPATGWVFRVRLVGGRISRFGWQVVPARQRLRIRAIAPFSRPTFPALLTGMHLARRISAFWRSAHAMIPCRAPLVREPACARQFVCRCHKVSTAAADTQRPKSYLAVTQTTATANSRPLCYSLEGCRFATVGAAHNALLFGHSPTMWCPFGQPPPPAVGNRLTVDPRTLTPLVLVRIQVPQPSGPQ